MKKNHEISLQEAIDMTSRFRANRPEGLPNSEAFEVGAVEKLLSTPNAAFLRVYYGRKADGSVHAILVAADEGRNDLLPKSSAASSEGDPEDEPVILEDGIRCPPICPDNSPLNGED